MEACGCGNQERPNLIIPHIIVSTSEQQLRLPDAWQRNGALTADIRCLSGTLNWAAGTPRSHEPAHCLLTAKNRQQVAYGGPLLRLAGIHNGAKRSWREATSRGPASSSRPRKAEYLIRLPTGMLRCLRAAAWSGAAPSLATLATESQRARSAC